MDTSKGTPDEPAKGAREAQHIAAPFEQLAVLVRASGLPTTKFHTPAGIASTLSSAAGILSNSYNSDLKDLTNESLASTIQELDRVGRNLHLLVQQACEGLFRTVCAGGFGEEETRKYVNFLAPRLHLSAAECHLLVTWGQQDRPVTTRGPSPRPAATHRRRDRPG